MKKHKKTFRFLAFFIVSALFLTAALPVMAFAESENVAIETEQVLLVKIDAMLAEDRVPGEVLFFMQDGLILEDTSAILRNLDLPNNFDDTSVYLYRSFDHEYNDGLWFTLKVSEDEIRDVLLRLLQCEEIKSAMPNALIQLSDAEESGTYSIDDGASDPETEMTRIDSEIASESAAGVPEYDEDTTAWALDEMRVREAWENGFVGSYSVTVAVIDSGYAPHVDMNSWFVDTARAKNVYNFDSDLSDEDNMLDPDGHGTFIIGQIAAALDGSGVNGVCQKISILPIKICDRNAVDIEILLAGIEYAIACSVDIINLSYSIPASFEERVVDAVSEYDGLFVVSAGNEGVKIEEAPSDFVPGADEEETIKYSASGVTHHESNWLVVGASTQEQTIWKKSNYSSKYVDILAPGVDITGLDNNTDVTGSDYDVASGASMSTAYASAAAALIMSHASHMSATEVKELLMNSVEKKTGLSNYCLSGGILDLYGAVQDLWEQSRPAYSRGDASGDGEITAIDYMMVKRMVLETYTGSENERNAADADGSGVITSIDYGMIKRYVLNLRYFPPY